MVDRTFSYERDIIGKLRNFFYSNPDACYSINQLNNVFNRNVHHTLVQLENDSVIIRSKIEINCKPVTHWQYNKYQNVYSANNKYNNYAPLQIQVNNFHDESSRTITVKDWSYIPQEKAVSPTVTIHKRLVKSNGPKMDKPIDNCSRIEFDSLSPTSSSMHFKQSKLNPNSPEFKPIHKEKHEELPEISSEKSTLAVNNYSLAFMTAMTKNPVSVLHEFCQQRDMTCEFKILDIEGPSHKPRISIAAFLNGQQYETVITTNKKEGKRKAADIAIRQLISGGHFAEKPKTSSFISELKSDYMKAEKIVSPIAFDGNTISKYNYIASLVYNKFSELINKTSPKDGLSLAGRKVLSAIVMENDSVSSFKVVSLATGNRCITGDKMSLQGRIVNDSHAEVVARRSLMYFFYKQLDAFITHGPNYLGIFNEIDKLNSMLPRRHFRLKDNIKFHLYISTAPCGDGALFCNKEAIDKNHETVMVIGKDHNPLFENDSHGLLRTKIEGGEGTIPAPMFNECNQSQTLDGILQGQRLRTMSCSDKIARWNYLGIQGSLLGIFIEPIYLQSLILGNLFNARHLSRAVCCRLEKKIGSPLRVPCDVNHPNLVNVYIGELNREIDKANELSINWCHGELPELVDGVTGELNVRSNLNFDISRISKAFLFYEFNKICRKLDQYPEIFSMNYRNVKSLSTEYEDKKKELYLKFHCSKLGSWVRKPIEQSDFKNSYNIDY